MWSRSVLLVGRLLAVRVAERVGGAVAVVIKAVVAVLGRGWVDDVAGVVAVVAGCAVAIPVVVVGDAGGAHLPVLIEHTVTVLVLLIPALLGGTGVDGRILIVAVDVVLMAVEVTVEVVVSGAVGVETVVPDLGRGWVDAGIGIVAVSARPAGARGEHTGGVEGVVAVAIVVLIQVGDLL